MAVRRAPLSAKGRAGVAVPPVPAAGPGGRRRVVGKKTDKRDGVAVESVGDGRLHVLRDHIEKHGQILRAQSHYSTATEGARAMAWVLAFPQKCLDSQIRRGGTGGSSQPQAVARCTGGISAGGSTGCAAAATNSTGPRPLRGRRNARERSPAS